MTMTLFCSMGEHVPCNGTVISHPDGPSSFTAETCSCPCHRTGPQDSLGAVLEAFFDLGGTQQRFEYWAKLDDVEITISSTVPLSGMSEGDWLNIRANIERLTNTFIGPLNMPIKKLRIEL